MKSKTTTLDSQIRTRVDALLTELTNTIRQATLEAVHDALGGNLNASAPVASGTMPAMRSKTTQKTRGRAGTRSPQDIAKTGAVFAAYVKSHPGERLEQIAKGLNVSTKDLTYPVGKLLEAKQLSTKGRARGRKYFAK